MAQSKEASGFSVLDLSAQILLLALGAFSLFTAWAPLSQTDAWWIRVWDFPRWQLTVLYCVLAAFSFWGGLSRRYLHGLGVLLVISALWQLSWIWPYTPLASVQTKSSPRPTHKARLLKLLTANVKMSNRRYKDAISVFKQHSPDIIALTEVDQRWIDALKGFADA